jgi:hypothetical protein
MFQYGKIIPITTKVEGLDNLSDHGINSQIDWIPPPSRWVRKYSIVSLVIDAMTYAYLI